MDLETAEHNLQVLLKLEPYEKLTVDKLGKMNVDPRYLPSVRRTITWDSRKDILIPFEQTFTALTLSDEEKVKALNKIEATFKQTYPAFSKLHDPKEGLLPRIKQECSARMLQNMVSTTGKSISSMVDKKMFEMEKAVYDIPSEDQQELSQIVPGTSFDMAISNGIYYKGQNTNPKQCPPTTTKEKSDIGASSMQTLTSLSAGPTTTQTNLNAPLNMSDDLRSFLNIPKTAKLTSKEIEFALHRYILKNKLYKSTAKTISLDGPLAQLCGLDQTKEITNSQLKVQVFSRHVQHVQ
jgi:hypothetical protein